ncbi:hypothetical protein [Myroides odoratimimus]|uniref:hypothetical protein n=1 Tax=Myroides odoratimimus TaxID=76832 RepID=UPI001CE16BE2|nr:hypothetical protein [Myroides odoratimimus]MCA4806882.1 hypothetical protein [Myroides odoratimimus]MDM1530338.1 hypothetical protein [Myroides odoratimimus]
MKKTLFYIALSISVVIYVLQKSHIALPAWVNNYVNDFLTLPLVLSICQYILRKLKKQADLLLPLSLILFVALYYSVYFEWYLPQHNPRYTGDWLDCVMYFSGAGVFYLLNNTVLFRFRKEKRYK